MTTTIYLGIENRGGFVVAVFADGCGDTFALNRESLLSRIENVQAGCAHPSRDDSEEQAALRELEAYRQ